MNTEENRRYPVLVPSERWRGKKNYAPYSQQTCKLKKNNTRMLKVTLKKVSAFLHEATRQGHVNNLADASLQKPWLVVTELSSSEFRLAVTTRKGGYIDTCNSFGATVLRPGKLKNGRNPTETNYLILILCF